MFSINEQQQLINIYSSSSGLENQLTIDDIQLIKKELTIYKEKYESINKFNIKLEEEMICVKKNNEEKNKLLKEKLIELVKSQKEQTNKNEEI